MGRGLSDLQKTILRLALANRDKDLDDETHGADVYHWEILAEYFGWKEFLDEYRLGSHSIYVRFPKEQIEESRYRGARVSLTRALDRLQTRGLLTRVTGMHFRWMGANLTPKGIEIAKTYRLTL